MGDPATLFGLQIKRDAFLARRGLDARHLVAERHAVGVAALVLDLDYTGAERRQHRQSVRHCVEIAELDDRHARQRVDRRHAKGVPRRARIQGAAMRAQFRRGSLRR